MTNPRFSVACILLVLAVAEGGRLQRVLREVTKVYRAAAPPPEAGGESSWGPRRAIGGSDINGDGVPHAFQHCHPFLFLEDALLPRGQMPPFGKHPHAGLCSVTILFRGDHLKPWDSMNGDCPVVESGGMYVLHSGTGIVHAEEEVLHNAADASEYTHACFLWFDPGISHPMPRMAHTQILQHRNIPEVIQEGGMRIRVLLGEYRHKISLAQNDHARLLLLDCYLDVDAPQQVVSLPADAPAAFVYVPWNGGEGEFGGSKVRVAALEVGHVTGEGRALTVKNVGRTRLHCLIGAGESRGSVPCMLFGNNGAVAQPSEEAARCTMARYERDPEGFGALLNHFR
eukprot:CAMPEP_0177729612 /NCGR_PEP_ID=MMETSP0484_2-20121128/21532_1 /TAXON_ID=354590 /ORGANISM="Rhodomonas lens, Strain RHODO" /LENGTH=341 /DNA_ID=CAMNT_0019242513 /DNA_START=92 /DNA_END=1114 /DNA_ORIENTATION=-